MNKKQLSNILGAGTITGFILALLLLFNAGDVQGETAVSPPTTAGITEVVPMENYTQLQAQNDQLVQDLQVMQLREQQYEAQITTANRLVAQQNTTATQNIRFNREEHDDD